MDYFRSQFLRPYRSTLAFTDWLAELDCVRPGTEILDLGCGMGEFSNHFAKTFPAVRVLGLDNNPQLVAEGNAILAGTGVGNLSLALGDLYGLEAHRGKVDGVICTQTLSWLPEAEAPLASFADTGCRWIAVSSLFYAGPVSAKIEVTDHASKAGSRESRESFYNIYSLPATIGFLNTLGFTDFEHRPFDIDIDLPPPADKGMGTYTVELKSGKRLQISGPVLMSWHFLFAERGRADGRVSGA